MKEKKLLIEQLAFGGDGLGREEGKVVFVPGTVPGDRVHVRILSDHGGYERAELLEVIEASQDRVDPPCEVFGTCGGCQWQHVSYEAQLRWKQHILKETLERVGKIKKPHVLSILPASHPWHYRNRIQVKVNENGEVGFYARKSHGVVTFEECHIADTRLNEKLKQIKKNSLSPGDLEMTLDENFQVHLHDATKRKTLFSQVNRAQNKKLISVVLHFAFGHAHEAFTRCKTVIELYAGSGNFSFPLAARAGDVYCVEENKELVRQGEETALSEGIENLHWIAGHAEWGLKKLYRRKVNPDLLVLDPPRRGAKEILDLVCVMKPRQIVYVSCDPVTLARDLKFLTRRHYQLEKVRPVDMFPQTYHIESVSLLSFRPE